ncbi:MAG: Gfo/Idh/MocA family oxidoreductase [Saprospiraceae bacterium]|nr:Gfo/Idh/MocA family oxidoreductase [Saprospiraceae bacterium]
MLRIGLIGCGEWGRKILGALQYFGHQVVVHDIDPDLDLPSLDQSSIISSWTEYEALTLDGHIIATPATTHLKILDKLLSDQVPIFIEKPLAMSYLEVQHLEELRRDDIFMMHIWKYHAGIVALKDLIASGVIGSLKSIRSKRCNWTSPRQDIDSVWNLMPHDLSIIDCLLGDLPDPYFAVVEEYNSIPRSMIAVLGTDPFCHIEVSNRHWTKSREVRIHGTNGVAVLKDEVTDHLLVYLGDDSTSAGESTVKKMTFDYSHSALELEIESFCKYLKGGPPPLSDLKEGIRITKYIESLRKLAQD